MGALLAPERPGHGGDTGGSQPPPPMLPSVLHSGAVEVTEQDAPANRAAQEGSGEEVKALGGGGGAGGHLKGI